MNRSDERLLTALSDDTWHIELPNGVGPSTVNRCIDAGFVKTKRVGIKREGGLETYRIALRITAEGKSALRQTLFGSAS